MKKSKDNRKFLLCLSILVDTLCWSIVLPVLPGLHDTVFHINNVTIGAISSLLSLLMFICGTLQGRASDYFGRISMLRISAVAQLLGHICIPVSIKINSVLLYILARCIPSLFKCGMVVSQAYLYDISSAIDISKDLGNLLAYSNIGFILGPLLGGYAQGYNVYLTFGIGCVLAVTNLYILYQLEHQLHSNSKMTSSNGHPHHTSSNHNIIVNSNHITKNNDINHCNNTNVSIPTTTTDVSIHSITSNSFPKSNNNSHNKNNNNDKSSSNLSSIILDHSFLQYLHIKFAFQMGNSLFESLFTQHARTQLGLKGSSIGLLLSFSGLISAFTNKYLLRYITSMANSSSTTSITTTPTIQSSNKLNSRSSSSSSNGTVKAASNHNDDMSSFYPEKFLWCYVLGTSCGLYTWAVGSTVSRYGMACINILLRFAGWIHEWVMEWWMNG